MSTTIQRARHRLRLWPRLSRWGATDEEVAGPHPGAELVRRQAAGSHGRHHQCHPRAGLALARPDGLGPWRLVFLGPAGQRRPAKRHRSPPGVAEPRRRRPVAVALGIGARHGRLLVAVIEPNRFLGLYGYTDGEAMADELRHAVLLHGGTRGFLLNESPDGRTRLVISGYQTFRPRWVERFASWLLIAVSWPMQARMMAVLKRNIERAARTGVTTVPGARCALRASRRRVMPPVAVLFTCFLATGCWPTCNSEGSPARLRGAGTMPRVLRT